eukprot:TRINITY_DN2463_c0_g1_i1.p1 TRINITY_DN2463_c0_g1~~TRINITY_DN2463_c0_g1_i1.p1  ORF type:complete len:1366 (-),score=299.74 TRINITY_DN2463_c0_g1_i1:107-4141(-)
MKKGRGVVVLLLLSLVLVVNCQDIQFWTSLPNTLYAQQIIAGTQLAFQYANENIYTGLLFANNVSLQILNDTTDNSFLVTNVNTVLNQPVNSTFGLLYSSGNQGATMTQGLVNSTSLPFINPLSGLSSLRTFARGTTPLSYFARNIINLRPSSDDQAYSLVYYCIEQLSIQRFGIIYSGAEGEGVMNHTKTNLEQQGLSLTTFNFSANPNVAAAFNDMTSNQVEATILWIDSASASNYTLLSRSQQPNTYLLISGDITLPVAENTTLSLGNTGNASILNMAVYPYFTPVTSSLVTDFSAQLKNLPAQEAQLANSTYGLEGYYTGRWISAILSRMDPSNATRSDFLNTVYNNQVFKVGGFTVGPLSDLCGNQLFPCCNQAIHKMSVYGLVYDTAKAAVTNVYPVDNGSISWSTCDFIGNAVYPVNFATVYDPADPIATATIKGIENAFDSINNDINRVGFKPLQLLKIPIDRSSSNTPFLDATINLLNSTNITSLMCLTEEASLEVLPIFQSNSTNGTRNNNVTLYDPISPLSVFRNSSLKHVINLRSSLEDSIINTLLFIMGRNSSAPTRNLKLQEAQAKQNLKQTPIPQGILVGIYWQNDTQGREFYKVFNETVNDLNDYYAQGNAKVALVGSTDKPLLNSITLIMQLSSTDIENKGIISTAVSSAYPRNIGYPIDWLIYNSREDISTLVDIAFQTTINQPNDLTLPSANASTSEIATKARVVPIGVSSLANVPFAQAAIKKELLTYGMVDYPLNMNGDLFRDYVQNFGNPNPNTIEAELGGFLAGKAVSQVVDKIRGDINSFSFFQTVYSTFAANIIVDNVQKGSYGIDSNGTVCNEGAKQATVYALNSTDTIYSSTWAGPNGCGGAKINFIYPNTNQNNSATDQTAIVVSTVVVVVVVLACILILIIICVVIIIFSYIYYPKSKRKRHLKEPRYEAYAIKEKFLEKQNIDAMLIASLPHITNSTKREKLDLLEAFIMKPESIYPVIQGLTKAGLARDDVASCLIYIYTANEQVEALLNYGIKKEISQASHEATLFREDSSLAALWSAYNRLVGLPYLWKVLAETLYDIAQVSGEKHAEDEGLLNAKNLEIDKHRLSTVEERFVNILHLKLAAQTTFNKVRMTPFPSELKVFLKRVRTKMMKNYSDLANGVIANFVFLRFICLAITTPNYFGLWKTSPNEKTLRFLVLMSKVIQNLGFGVEFMKEESMTDMNDFINQNRDTMNAWLEAISTDDSSAETGTYQKIEVNETLKENCLKWMFSQMYMNRQVLRRELEKKMDSADWKTSVTELEEIGVFKAGGSSDSFSGGLSTLTERGDSKRGKISDSHSGSSGQGRYSSTEDET